MAIEDFISITNEKGFKKMTFTMTVKALTEDFGFYLIKQNLKEELIKSIATIFWDKIDENNYVAFKGFSTYEIIKKNNKFILKITLQPYPLNFSPVLYYNDDYSINLNKKQSNQNKFVFETLEDAQKAALNHYKFILKSALHA